MSTVSLPAAPPPAHPTSGAVNVPHAAETRRRVVPAPKNSHQRQRVQPRSPRHRATTAGRGASSQAGNCISPACRSTALAGPTRGRAGPSPYQRGGHGRSGPPRQQQLPERRGCPSNPPRSRRVRPSPEFIRGANSASFDPPIRRLPYGGRGLGAAYQSCRCSAPS